MEMRPAPLAGRWYPSSSAACDALLDAAGPTPATPPSTADDAAGSAAVGALVPHAGWAYSGATAWAPLRALSQARGDADLVLAFGGHLGRRDRPRLQLDGAWTTPYGPLEIAAALAHDLAMAVECELESSDDFYEDNALEVVMPMLRRAFPRAVVLGVGLPPTDEAPDVGLEALRCARGLGFRRIVVVGSTDLTHYGPNYDFQPHGRGETGLRWVKEENDAAAIRCFEALDVRGHLWEAPRRQNACCPGAAAAAMAVARAEGATAGHLLHYTTSWDVRPDGPPTSFVGYAGLLLSGLTPHRPAG
jgi:AmmeMemoRadiSam system protein B